MTGLTALQLVNVSIDASDPAALEDLSVNEIESCVELLVELVLHHDNAIPEIDDSDDSSAKPGQRHFIDFLASENTLVKQPDFLHLDDYEHVSLKTHFVSLTRPIMSPPPRQA
jgi:hypothetical protein